MHKRCLPRFGGPLRRAGLAGSGIVSGGPRRADDVKRQHVNGERSRHGSATFDGTATPPLMSHKVMFVLLGECVCGCLSPCVAASIQCVSSSVCMCARVMDSEQTLSVRGAASQLIRCGRCSYQVLQQLLLTPPSIFPKWQASSIKEKKGGKKQKKKLCVVLSVRTWSQTSRQMSAAAPYGP